MEDGKRGRIDTSLPDGADENDGGLLSPDHRAMLLEESAITPEVVKARSYRTVYKKVELEGLGFGRSQRKPPGLLIPIHGPAGGVVLYQFRPDEPRINRGKPVKYETPAGSRTALDVHPFCQEKLEVPSVPLFVTEGIKKGDALVSQGLCAVALIGVWNWRGTNERGGKAALADWEYMALNDRRIYVVFDSDVMLKPEVHAALARLKGFLESRGAKVVLIYLPADEGGGKQGVDDYLAAGHTTDDLLALATHELRKPPREERSERSCPYRETPGGLVWDKPTQSGTVPTSLTNFTARIVRDVARDDGAEVRRFFEVEATLNGRREVFAVSSSQFAAMNWPTEHLGAGAILYPGFGAREHARTAIQMLSGDVPADRVFGHTGWREIGGEWVYLHAGGAIGRDGQVNGICTELGGVLEGRTLPDPASSTPDGLRAAVRASLDMLGVIPSEAGLSFSALGAVYRAALGGTDSSLHISGPSGGGKSELLALMMQHFGAGLDARHLTSWESTANAIAGQAFQAKDQLLGLDDFAPTGSAYDVQRLHRKADQVLRGAGNNSARQRMRADETLRPEKPPRATIVSTGEDVPRGQSLRARMLALELGPDRMDWPALTDRQRDAGDGLYALSMSGYVRWLAPRYGEILVGLRDERSALREAARADAQHRRTPGIVADVALGLRYFLRYACQTGAVEAERAEELWARGWLTLGIVAADQRHHQAAGEPTQRFAELLSAAIASGRAHVAGPGGDVPPSPEAWGWRLATVGTGDHEREEWRFQGKRVGWLEDQDLYLEPDASYAAVQEQGRDSGDALTITGQTLRKRLHQRGLLASTDDARQTLTVRRSFEGKRRSVLHILKDSLSPGTDQPDQPDQDHEKPFTYRDSTPPLWSGSETEPDQGPDRNPTNPGSGQVVELPWSGPKIESDQETDQQEVDKTAENSTNGQVSRVFRGGRETESGGVERDTRADGLVAKVADLFEQDEAVRRSSGDRP